MKKLKFLKKEWLSIAMISFFVGLALGFLWKAGQVAGV
jgi:hypothetical protein